MYKKKYYKYKYKYLKLKLGGGNTNEPVDEPDIVDIDEQDDLIISDVEEDISFDIETDDEDTEELIEKYSTISQDLQLTKISIHEIYEYEDSMFIDINSEPDKNKILKISTNNNFDEFTDRFGELKKADNLFINFDKVSNLYKGIYLSSSALADREDKIPYKNTIVNTWVNMEFDGFVDKVLIFVKQEPAIYAKTINSPFKAKVVDEYAVEKFINIYEKDHYGKVLIIDTVEAFDQFTNKYGYEDNKKININWNDVITDYGGIYIDKDNDFKDVRYKYAFLGESKYKSWWPDIKDSVVYLFE